MAKAKPLPKLDLHAPTTQNACIIVSLRLEEFYSWHRHVDHPQHIKELHNLRIAAKRLRYTLEIFEDVLPDACKPFLKELTEIQEELGTLHDSDVMIALLHLCLSKHPTAHTIQESAVPKERQNLFLLQPELVTYLLEPTSTLASEERHGLELLLLKQQQSREEQYTTLREHWHQLQKQDFRSQLLAILNT